MKKYKWVVGSLILAIVAAIGVVAIPNPLSKQLLAEAKYRAISLIPLTRQLRLPIPDAPPAILPKRCSNTALVAGRRLLSLPTR